MLFLYMSANKKEDRKVSKTVDGLRGLIETEASKLIERPFTLVSYSENAEDASEYEVLGTIPRYDGVANVAVTFKKEPLDASYWSITDDGIQMPTERVGSIELSEKICVTDPCYKRDVWCMSQLENVNPGTWNVFASIDTIDSWGERVYVLELYHDCLTDEQKEKLKWSNEAELGVDSGQMSVFDDAFYRRKNGSIEDFVADDKFASDFYDECCRLTDDRIGIYYSDGLPVGIVCSSGCGDGCYPLDTYRIDGQIVAMKICFL
jgi:hypothetical protein